ncbi:hypothetical protein Btru_077536 [Bulinus truncatus]|nr:hypothetical protein Btru_077536 [Bulinus truncatus]
MPSSLALALIGALAVVMATAAPLSNQEKFVDTPQTGGVSVDRAKRAQEEISFGNQQNKPRVVAKKSDLSNLLVVPAAPLGEKDKSGVVVVQGALPVPPALDARAEAVLEENRDKEKVKEEVEAALQEISQPNVPQNVVEETKEGVKELVKEELANEAKEAAAVKAAASEEPSGEANEVTEGDEVDQFLHEIQDKDAENGLDLNTNNAEDSNVNNDIYPVLYLNTPYRDFGFPPRFPYAIYRRKRAIRRVRKFSPAIKSQRGARRIKRDSLSDLYGAYVNEDPRAEAEEYVALSPEEKEYLYRRLLDNLVGLYDQGQDGEGLQEVPVDVPVEAPYLEEAEDEPYIPYEVYNENGNYEPYGAGYRSEQPEYEPVSSYAKRGMVDYYPLEEVEKRYFFPFSDEPDTHWGAFVPEKRDYDESIQRLQRLAMALSDSPGPYYKEMMEVNN